MGGEGHGHSGGGSWHLDEAGGRVEARDYQLPRYTVHIRLHLGQEEEVKMEEKRVWRVLFSTLLVMESWWQ